MRAVAPDEANDPPLPGLRAHRDLVEALRRSQDGSPEEADARFRTAIAGYQTWGSPVYAARAHAAYGAWLLGQGRVDEAESHLDDARTAYADLGAVAWLEDLERSVAAARVGS